MITIGIPVYNEEKYILETLNSAVNQADEIIISDNASTDHTGEICKEFAVNHQNVAYIRQEKNIGSLENFHHVLMQAKSEYFMWLGGHDLIPDGYTNCLAEALEANPNAVLAYTPAEHIDPENKLLYVYDYDFHKQLNSKNLFKRFFTLIDKLSDCSLVHGLYRTDILRRAWVDKACIGVDHILLCRVALYGPFIYCPSIRFIRRDIRNDSPDYFQKQYERITGTCADLESNIFEEMIKGQIKNIKGIKTRLILDKIIWSRKIKKRLVERFGGYKL